MPLDAEALVAQLQLSRHPEGGWYREIFRAPHAVTRGDGALRSGTSLIWFLLAAGQRSVWHRVSGGDEIWYFVDGGPVQLTWILPDDSSHRVVLGPRGSGHVSSAVVPADSWQKTKPLDDASLLQCSVSPGFDFADFALLRDLPAELIRLRQQHAAIISDASIGWSRESGHAETP
jgi:uncharacterized protein